MVDTRPAPGAVIVLHPVGGSGERSRAQADANGEFTMGTFAKGDGAPAGEYVVTVEWKRADEHPEHGIDQLPAMYADPKTSNLRVSVVAGANEPLNLNLSKKP